MDAARRPASSIFQGAAGTMAANIRMTGPDPGDHRARVKDAKGDRHHVHHEPDRKRHRHQVHEGQIGDEERIGIAAAEIEEEREGDRDAPGGDDVGLPESGPPRVGRILSEGSDVSQGRAEEPEPTAHQGKNRQPPRGLAKQVLRDRAGVPRGAPQVGLGRSPKGADQSSRRHLRGICPRSPCSATDSARMADS